MIPLIILSGLCCCFKVSHSSPCIFGNSKSSCTKNFFSRRISGERRTLWYNSLWKKCRISNRRMLSASASVKCPFCTSVCRAAFGSFSASEKDTYCKNVCVAVPRSVAVKASCCKKRGLAQLISCSGSVCVLSCVRLDTLSRDNCFAAVSA